MAKIQIPGLYRKFRLLIDYGRVEDWEALGALFGAKPSTVKWWGHGNVHRPPDQLPSQHLEKFVALVAGALPPEISPETVKDLVHGPVASFEAALRNGRRSCSTGFWPTKPTAPTSA